MKKFRFKKFIKTVALVLVGAMIGGALIGFTDLGEKMMPQRNEDNLIEVNDSYIQEGTNNKGVSWKVADDGTVKLYGTASEADSIVIQSLELPAGTYTYSVGNDDVNVNKYYSYVSVNGVEYIAGTSEDTFELVEDSTVQVVICWLEETSFGEVLGTTFRPMIVEGENAGEFFAK